MRLAYCIFKYFCHGGLQQDFLAIAKACLQREHSIEVFTMDWQGEQYPQLPVHILKRKGFSNHARARYFATQMASFAKYFDCVIGFNKMPGLNIYFAGDDCIKAKVLQKTQQNWLQQFNPRYRAYLKLEEEVFGLQAQTQCLLISERQRHEFQQHYQTSANRLHLLPPYINHSFKRCSKTAEKRQQLRAQLQISPHEKVILSVASYFHTKGLDRSIQAFLALPKSVQSKTRFLIIGKDDRTAYLKLLDQAQVIQQVDFLGARQDVAEVMCAADIFIHPPRTEAAGKVLLEAMAMGLPLLTTSNCGYAHYVQAAQAGVVLPYHVDEFDQTALNLNLLQLLSDDHLLQGYHQSALRYTSQADWYAMPEKVCDFVEQFAIS